ncbi:MAG: hypothetical protein CL844_04050 [Crocinitomicaceae bacterium]|nr:hypothetical protein [Crocinitomicaceae bacterium]|tara:strand:+ start:6530 stop:7168 length:639 start_codon:yes stop_codon:yes gene_type:complete
MEYKLSYKKSFRYEVLNDTDKPFIVLYVFHGYGQLAKFFIQKFKSLNKNILIVAPEGMHRFYLQGNYGRVGASWMTKEDRKTDIKDNISWLTALDEKISTKYNIKKRILLGFSQGGSTAIRWRLCNKVIFNAVIIWASDFPPEYMKKGEILVNDDENHFVVGSKDEYFNENKRNELINQYKLLGFNIITYHGNHEIDVKTVKKLIEKIEKKL